MWVRRSDSEIADIQRRNRRRRLNPLGPFIATTVVMLLVFLFPRSPRSDWLPAFPALVATFLIAFVLFYLSAGIVSAAVHVLFFSDSLDPVIGASGAISGVFGAVLMLMRQVGSLSSVLPIAGIWIALNVFFGLFGGTPGAGGEPVAWMAHIGGFVYGLAAIRLFVPRRPGA